MCLFWLFLLLAPSVAAAQETPETGSLEGRVLHALTREPVPRAALTLTLEGRPGHPLEARPPERQASTDADGRFRFDALPPGRYYLRARKAGFLFQYYNPLPRGSGAAPIPITASATPASLEMLLFPQAVVSGRVLDENGEPAERVYVALESLEYTFLGRRRPWPVHSAPTDDQGEFRFPGLAPGRYYLWIRPRPSLMVEGFPTPRDPNTETELDFIPFYYPNAPDLESATPIDLEPGTELTGILIRPRKFPTFRVQGRVAGHDRPDAPSGLTLFPFHGSPITAITGRHANVLPDGSFEFAGVAPGRYYIAAQRREGVNPWLWHAEVHVGRQDVSNITVEYTPPARIACQILIEGDDTQEPTPSPIVASLMPLDGPLLATPRGWSEHRREFTIENAVPGHYWLQIGGRPQPDSWLKTILFDGREVTDSGVVVLPGASSRLSLVFAPGAASLSGMVTNPDGEPVPGVTVALVPERPNPTRPDLYPQAAATASGAFELHDLAPGRYLLYAFDHLPPGAHLDPEFLKPHLSRATRLEIEPGGRHQITLRHRATSAK